MYHINIILYGYNQLKVIQYPFLQDLERRMISVAKANGGLWQDGYPYQIILSSEYEESAMIALECASAVAQELTLERHKHIGWNIIVMRATEQDFNRLDQLVNTIDSDDAIWIDKKDLDLFHTYIRYETKEDLVKILTLEEAAWLHRDVAEEFLMQTSIAHLLKKDWYGIFQAKFLLFYGEIGMGKRYTLESLLADISIDEDFRFASVDSYTQKYAMVEPFLSLFSPAVLELTESTVSHDEIFLFNYLRGFQSFLQSPNSCYALDRLSEDLILFIPFYLRAYKKYCQQKRIPCWILLFYTQYLHAINHQILDQLLRIAYALEITIIALEHKLIPFSYYEVEAYMIQEHYYYSEDISIYALPNASKVTPYEALLIQWLRSQNVAIEQINLASLIRSVFWHLDELAQQLLFYVMLADGMIEEDILIESLQLGDQGKILAYKRMHLLEKLRLVNNFYHKPRLVYSLLQIELHLYAKNKNADYLQKLCDYLIGQQDERYVNRWHLFLILEKNSSIDKALLVLHQYLYDLLDSSYTEIYYYTARKYFADQKLTDIQKVQLQIILDHAILRAQMMKHQEVDDDVRARSESDDIFSDYYSLQYYRYQIMKRNADELQAQLKKLTFSFQKKSEHKGEGLSNYELAYHNFKKGKLRIAMEFCEIAHRLFFTCHYNHGELMAGSLHVVLLFCYGNLSMAMEQSVSKLKEAEKWGNHHYWHLLRFLQSRIDMELGRYNLALKRLEEDIRFAQKYDKHDLLQVLQNWVFRCYVHLGQKEVAKKYGETLRLNLELSYFYAELYFIDNDYENMALVLENSYNMDRNSHLTFSECRQWIDGFNLLEGQRQIEGKRLLRCMADEMRLYALAKSPLMSDAKQQRAMENLQNTCELHETQIERSYNFILPYLYADSVKDIDSELSKIAVNRALRIAMSWSNRIGDIRVKDEYVQNNFWIKRMYLLR